ncbi:NADH dehydrogenase [Endomicrobiia bacterium]|uniref:NADH-Fd-dependent Fe-hydrogenase, ferredoxin-binding component 24kDa n=1 Tax=Endomicrobium trichonymphae TaxID=1408204 RepID=B1H0H5_ENDTX|nr:NAD(P)H-dependent oxidoreductase subunit E [Candidatus Endomicrobium trichonymphae]GHT08092.1 NADH dehydrogenase [Endomicrobiia bacterium]BAG14007.1 NADH-Fd-dependent Fe-hydrogenase, ferredoxin-binding component 24kDa [Candidatus Endomicrobium trichonymphae]BAV59071.1 NAD+-dependent Fe-hydrogenase, NADH dehydrogenase component [Candidatus Endomicrobium trichonymphae]GHT17309.1 NADH dehydrogenase [Endomicrobiia bacterium]GHT23627.1 NADH dehydrogenase [Endomicrobiia bacterium]
MDSNYSKFKTVCRILKENSFDKSKLIPILQAVQEEYKYLPKEILVFIALSLNTSPAGVYGVATFFSHFTLKHKGRHIIKICDGIACHVKKSNSLINALKNKLGLKEAEYSTKDVFFTIETVSCLGACGLAPVFLIDEDIYGQMTPDKAVELIDKIME